DNIRRSLPKVIAEISTRMAETQMELLRLGSPLESPGAQRQQFGKWVNQYLRLMEAAISGQYELLHPVLRSSSARTIMPEAHLRAVLRLKELVFRSEIEATQETNGVLGFCDSSSSTNSGRDVIVGDRVAVKLGRQHTMICKVIQTRGTDVLCDEFPHEWLGVSRWSFASGTIHDGQSNGSTTLKQFIQVNRGDELAIFPSYRVFCSCVQRCVRDWELPATKLPEHYHTQTGSTSRHLISALLADSGNVRVQRFFKKTTDRVLAGLKESAQHELHLLLQHEARPYTQDQRLYDELDRLRQQALHARLEAALPAGDKHGLVSVAEVTRALGGISTGPFGMSSDDREALEMEVVLRAYLEVASHRFVDVVPMKLNGLLLESFLREMESELLGAATDEQVAELLHEDDDKAIRRRQLLNELETLENGRQTIENSGYW
ncbi:hypothetical protein PR003_g29993, partial [Phytophthora rubi]